jgi:hypothetical protein
MKLPNHFPQLAGGPQLRSYDAIVVAISGGKDSQVALAETVRAYELVGRKIPPGLRLLNCEMRLDRLEEPGREPK